MAVGIDLMIRGILGKGSPGRVLIVSRHRTFFRWWTLGVFALGMVALPTQGWAKIFRIQPIPAKSVKALNPKARAAYEKSIEHGDHIRYQQAFEAARQASKLEPRSIQLRFYCVQFADYLAVTSVGKKSQEYYEESILQLDAVLKTPKITNDQKKRAEFALKRHKELKDQVQLRDERIQAWGEEFAIAYSHQIYKDELEDTKQERLDQVVDALARPQDADESAAKSVAEDLAEDASNQ